MSENHPHHQNGTGAGGPQAGQGNGPAPGAGPQPGSYPAGGGYPYGGQQPGGHVPGGGYPQSGPSAPGVGPTATWDANVPHGTPQGGPIAPGVGSTPPWAATTPYGAPHPGHGPHGYAPQTPPPSRTGTNRGLLWGLVGVLALALLGGLSWFLFLRPSDERATPAVVTSTAVVTSQPGESDTPRATPEATDDDTPTDEPSDDPATPQEQTPSPEASGGASEPGVPGTSDDPLLAVGKCITLSGTSDDAEHTAADCTDATTFSYQIASVWKGAHECGETYYEYTIGGTTQSAVDETICLFEQFAEGVCYTELPASDTMAYEVSACAAADFKITRIEDVANAECAAQETTWTVPEPPKTFCVGNPD